MTADPVNHPVELEARMRAVSEQFDKSVERKAKGPSSSISLSPANMSFVCCRAATIPSTFGGSANWAAT